MLRFFTVYGPRQRPDLAIYKFTNLISQGKPIPVFGNGKTQRDYTYISDIVDGVIAVTQKEFGFQIFNLGEAQTVQLWYLISLIENALGKKAIIDRQPAQPGVRTVVGCRRGRADNGRFGTGQRTHILENPLGDRPPRLCTPHIRRRLERHDADPDR